MLNRVIEWLAASAVSQWVQSTPWAIPTLQSLHILAISAVTATSFIVVLRVFGVLPALQPVADLIAGSVRAIWAGIAVCCSVARCSWWQNRATSCRTPRFN